jgi:hypothetical protein
MTKRSLPAVEMTLLPLHILLALLYSKLFPNFVAWKDKPILIQTKLANV